LFNRFLEPNESRQTPKTKNHRTRTGNRSDTTKNQPPVTDNMSSIFTKIIHGEIPSYKVAETDSCYAFLDINPLAEGHVLAIPRKEVDYLFDVDDSTYSDLMLFSKNVALAIKKVVPCERIGVAVIGLEVPHAHVHLIPINAIHDIDFSRPKLSFSELELRATADKILEAFESA